MISVWKQASVPVQSLKNVTQKSSRAMRQMEYSMTFNQYVMKLKAQSQISSSDPCTGLDIHTYSCTPTHNHWTKTIKGWTCNPIRQSLLCHMESYVGWKCKRGVLERGNAGEKDNSQKKKKERRKTWLGKGKGKSKVKDEKWREMRFNIKKRTKLKLDEKKSNMRRYEKANAAGRGKRRKNNTKGKGTRPGSHGTERGTQHYSFDRTQRKRGKGHSGTRLDKTRRGNGEWIPRQKTTKGKIRQQVRTRVQDPIMNATDAITYKWQLCFLVSCNGL